jgi:uncharacterized membrane protein
VTYLGKACCGLCCIGYVMYVMIAVSLYTFTQQCKRGEPGVYSILKPYVITQIVITSIVILNMICGFCGMICLCACGEDYVNRTKIDERTSYSSVP